MLNCVYIGKKKGDDSLAKYRRDRSLTAINFEQVKINLSQNVRIARKLKNVSTTVSAPFLGLEPQSLQRVEALNDSHYPSLEVLCNAIAYYNEEPNFYWTNWEENQKRLDIVLQERKNNKTGK